MKLKKKTTSSMLLLTLLLQSNLLPTVIQAETIVSDSTTATNNESISSTATDFNKTTNTVADATPESTDTTEGNSTSTTQTITNTESIGDSTIEASTTTKQATSGTALDASTNSGTFGTSKWYIEGNVLHIGAGDLAGTVKPGVITPNIPWYQNQNIKKIVFEGKVVANYESAYLFKGLSNLVEIEGLSNLDTSIVKSIGSMFSGDSSLTNLDLSSFDTSNVTAMGSMFEGMSSLTSLDLSSFDTSNVTTMGSMFEGDSSLTSLNVSSFSTSNVTNMGSMFKDLRSLKTLDVTGFDTSNVTGMSLMFYGMSGVTSLDISHFVTNNVTGMEYMFYGMSGLTNLNVSNFNTSKVKYTAAMFAGLSISQLDVSNFDTAQVIDMSSMFEGMRNLTSLDVSLFNTSSAKNMSRMFAGDSSLESLDLSNFNTKKVTDMANMFKDDSGLHILKLGVSSKFDSSTSLPEISSSLPYTGKWINLGTGTETNPMGDKIWSSSELMDNYDGNTDADTYVWQKTSVVTVHDSTIYVGDNWSAEDNFDSATDKEGNNVNFSNIVVNQSETSPVDTSKAGTYKVTYTYDGTSSIATITVLENKQSITGSDVTAYVGDAVPNDDTFKASATDKDGKTISVTLDKTKVDMTKAGDYDVVITSEDGQTKTVKVHVLENKQSITGSDVTKYVNDPLPADSEFKASATDKTGKDSPVTLDKTKVDMSKAGDYDVVITSEDGQTKTVKVHVLENKQSITGSDVTAYVGDAVPGDDTFKASATDKDGKTISVTLDKTKVDMTKAGDYDVVITSEDGQTKTVKVHVLENKQSITGSDVTKYVNDPLPADSEFKASATDKTGKDSPVTLDKTKVDMTKAGDYGVMITSADGQTKTVKVHVLEKEKPINPTPDDHSKNKSSDEKKSSEDKAVLPQTGENERISITGMISGFLVILGTTLIIIFKRKRQD